MESSSSDVFTNDNKALKVSKLSLKVTWLLFLYQENSCFNAAMEYLGHCLFVLNWALSIASRRKTGDENPPLA
jgi:hypothetical protein